MPFARRGWLGVVDTAVGQTLLAGVVDRSVSPCGSDVAAHASTRAGLRGTEDVASSDPRLLHDAAVAAASGTPLPPDRELLRAALTAISRWSARRR